MKKMKLIKVLLCGISCLLLTVPVFAQEEPRVLPDDPLYQAKRQMETAQLNADSDPLKKAAFYTTYAKERLAEVKAMIAKGKHEFIDKLLKDYEKCINGAMDEVNKAQAQGRDVSKALEAVETATKKHTEVLTDLLNKVPEEAEPAIRHSIEVSMTGRDNALDILEKIQSGEIPAGGPDMNPMLEEQRAIVNETIHVNPDLHEEIASPVAGEFSVGREFQEMVMQQDVGGIAGNTNGMDGFDDMTHETTQDLPPSDRFHGVVNLD